jgi:hypothetical protein
VAQEAPSSTEAVHTTGAGVPQHTQSAPPALAAVQAVVSGTANGSTADVREASTLASTQAARESSVEASGGIDAAVGPGATATPAAVTTCTPATLPRSATTPNVITAAAATKQPASTAPVQPFNPRAGSTGTGSERQQPPLGLLVDLRPHIITHVDAGARRTAALMRDSLMEATPARDRPFIKAFSETQMFQVGTCRRACSTACLEFMAPALGHSCGVEARRGAQCMKQLPGASSLRGDGVEVVGCPKEVGVMSTAAAPSGSLLPWISCSCCISHYGSTYGCCVQVYCDQVIAQVFEGSS